MANINLREVDDELARSMKVAAAVGGVTLKAWVESAARSALSAGVAQGTERGVSNSVVAGSNPASRSKPIPGKPDGERRATGKVGKALAAQAVNKLLDKYPHLEVERPVVDMEALRGVCAGNLSAVPVTWPIESFNAQAGDGGTPESGLHPPPPHSNAIEEDTELVHAHMGPSCVSCEAPLERGSGKLVGKYACADELCGMYGKEQKGER